MAELFEAYEQGRLTEAFGTGTAAVISPVGELAYHDRSMILNGGKIGPVAQEMYDCLVGIQRGERPIPTAGWSPSVNRSAKRQSPRCSGSDVKMGVRFRENEDLTLFFSWPPAGGAYHGWMPLFVLG